MKLFCSSSSSKNVINFHVLRCIQGCSPGVAPQITADAVLFMRPGGLSRVRSAVDWEGEIEAAGPGGIFSATRDGRYVAIKREGHGVSRSLSLVVLQSHLDFSHTLCILLLTQ
jgi:hypothetical protein